MIIDDKLLRRDERAVFTLRALFEQGGYTRFSMSRFEEYDLYAGNKDFLSGDRMISFTDVDGTLMALKPDVTISIIRHTKDVPGQVRKVYYNENVYRAAKGDNGFREIIQAGLECIGDLSLDDISQVLLLAEKSMEALGEPYVLNISHLGIVGGLLAAAGIPTEDYPKALRYLREKNAHGMTGLCRELNTSEDGLKLLLRLIELHGELDTVLPQLRELCADSCGEALEQLEGVYKAFADCGRTEKLKLDFSIVNNMAYYDGLVFQGYMRGVPESVLSGGQYDSLARKMGKKAGAIGFAVYLNKLEYLEIGND